MLNVIARDSRIVDIDQLGKERKKQNVEREKREKWKRGERREIERRKDLGEKLGNANNSKKGKERKCEKKLRRTKQLGQWSDKGEKRSEVYHPRVAVVLRNEIGQHERAR